MCVCFQFVVVVEFNDVLNTFPLTVNLHQTCSQENSLDEDRSQNNHISLVPVTPLTIKYEPNLKPNPKRKENNWHMKDILVFRSPMCIEREI